MIPQLEKDCSEEANTMISRSSTAVMGKDQRLGMKKMHDDDDQDGVFSEICPSWMGQIFQIKYMLKVYLKHDGFFERGQGSCVNLPIRVLAFQHTDPSSEAWRTPASWNPYQGTAEPTYLYL